MKKQLTSLKQLGEYQVMVNHTSKAVTRSSAKALTQARVPALPPVVVVLVILVLLISKGSGVM